MSLFDDQNKTEITKQITAATCFWLDERGFKPVETEVSVDVGWIADIASVVCPTQTELQDLKLIRRAPRWSKREEREAWDSEVSAMACMMTAIVEVKASRGDFGGDRKWKLAPPADLCWIAAPSGLIAPSERPEGWGILEYSEGRDCMVTRSIPTIRTTTHEQQRNLIHAVAMRRDNHTRYEHINRLRKAHAEDDKQRISLVRIKDAMRAALSIARGEHGSIEAALEYHRVKLHSIGELEMLKLTELWGVKIPVSASSPKSGATESDLV
jgi:hypothetical protein